MRPYTKEDIISIYEQIKSLAKKSAQKRKWLKSLKYIETQALHCGKISFVHPVSLEKITLTSEIPNDMKNIFSEAYVFAKEKGYKNVNSVLINS